MTKKVYTWRPAPDEPRAVNPSRFPVAPAEGRRNFGDELSRLIIPTLSSGGFELCNSIQGADLVAIGSHLDLAYRSTTKKGNRIDVWGTGFIAGGPPLEFSKRFKFHAVRGDSSRRGADLKAGSVPLGDPGLLVNRIIEPHDEFVSSTRSYELGIVPHYIDQEAVNTDHLERIAERFDTLWINVWDDPVKVAEQIGACERIISTSLHGCVVADALEVPNVWCELTNKVAGAGHKFWDYYTAFFGPNLKHAKFEPEWLRMDRTSKFDGFNRAWDVYQRPGLSRLRSDLIGAFPWT